MDSHKQQEVKAQYLRRPRRIYLSRDICKDMKEMPFPNCCSYCQFVHSRLVYRVRDYKTNMPKMMIKLRTNIQIGEHNSRTYQRQFRLYRVWYLESKAHALATFEMLIALMCTCSFKFSVRGSGFHIILPSVHTQPSKCLSVLPLLSISIWHKSVPWRSTFLEPSQCPKNADT